MVHIYQGKTLDALENQHRSSLDMCIFTQLLIFSFLVITEAIFQAEAFKFSSTGALNTLININPKFCGNRKILILLII